jgi:lysophospholipase
MIRLLPLITLALFLFPSCKVNFVALQKEENIHNLTTEENLLDSMYVSKIESFYSQGKEEYFIGQANLKIYYKTFIQEKQNSPAILISAGRTEAAIKYKELIYDLYQIGYSIYIHDHRGQGQSGRMTDDHDMGYIDTFQFYIDDMRYFYEQELMRNSHSKKYLLAHSMGGAIGMTYLEQYPNDFDAAAFSSPMLGLRPGTCSATKLLVNETPKYAAGQSEYQDDKLNFKHNKLTGSEIRYKRMNEAFAAVPQAKLGGASYQWIDRSCDQFEYLFENISEIQTPFILFSAKDEKIVYPKAHQHFIEKAQELNKTCEAFTIKNAKHELLVEKDEQRIEIMNHILEFYGRY